MSGVKLGPAAGVHMRTRVGTTHAEADGKKFEGDSNIAGGSATSSSERYEGEEENEEITLCFGGAGPVFHFSFSRILSLPVRGTSPGVKS